MRKKFFFASFSTFSFFISFSTFRFSSTLQSEKIVFLWLLNVLWLLLLLLQIIAVCCCRPGKEAEFIDQKLWAKNKVLVNQGAFFFALSFWF